MSARDGQRPERPVSGSRIRSNTVCRQGPGVAVEVSRPEGRLSRSSVCGAVEWLACHRTDMSVAGLRVRQRNTAISLFVRGDADFACDAAIHSLYG